jgi:hypothetical protein
MSEDTSSSIQLLFWYHTNVLPHTSRPCWPDPALLWPHVPVHCDRQNFTMVRGNPLSSIDAANCARALFASWISHLGAPAIITSDRGAQFTSALRAALFKLHISRSPTTVYYQQIEQSMGATTVQRRNQFLGIDF